VSVAGDRAALERALANLIANARVHGPPGGRITVALRAADGRAQLSVSDQGGGLSPEDTAHAFGRFWRGPRASERFWYTSSTSGSLRAGNGSSSTFISRS